MPEVISIDYATPAVTRPPSETLARVSFRLSALAGGVGVGILLLFLATDWTELVTAGFFWLGIGGLIAFVAFGCGASYAATAFARRFPSPATRWRAAAAVLAPLATLPLAFVCAGAGLAAAGRLASTVVIINRGTAPIDAVEFIDRRGTQALGALAGGASRRVLDRGGDGGSSLRLTRGGVPADYELDTYFIAMPGNPPRRVTIDAAGVVTLRGGYASATPTVLTPATGPVVPQPTR